MLGVNDPLPARPHRVLVAGTSGSGKSTLARRVGETLGVPYVELDSLYHGPNWTPRASFEDDVHRFTAQPAWVCEWQYGAVKEHLAGRADLMIWLDLPRWTVMSQIIRRTVGRRIRRVPLWNGNQEPPLWTIFTDREHIIRWAWNTHRKTGRQVPDLQERRPELSIVRLRSRAAIERWLTAALAAAAAGVDRPPAS